MSANELPTSPTTSAARIKVFISSPQQLSRPASIKSTTKSFGGNLFCSVFERGAFLRHNHRNRDCDGEDDEDYNQGKAVWKRKIVRHDHFDSDKPEDEGQSGFKVNEPIHQLGQKKIKRAQPENGADVGSINDKGIGCDREDRR